MQTGSVADTRRRLLGGAAEALREHGWAGLTVSDIVAASGVPRGAFHAEFADRRDCVLTAHQAAFERLMAEITRACAGESLWPRRLRAAIAALFLLAAAEPARVGLLACGALRVDRDIGPWVRERDAHLAALLRRGRRGTRLGAGLPELAEEALIAAVVAVLDERLRTPQTRLDGLEPELAQLLLIPYVGPAEAAWLAAS
jgi:AcrR family transcriptional regulator